MIMDIEKENSTLLKLLSTMNRCKDVLDLGDITSIDDILNKALDEIQTLREQVATGKRLLLEQIELTNEHTKLCIELRAKVASVDVLVEALRDIGSTNWHFSMSRKIANEALATYDKLSEVKQDTHNERDALETKK